MYKKTILSAAILIACFAATEPARAAYPFNDDFESGTGAWSTTGTWGLTTDTVHSPSHGLTDSVGTFYTNTTDASAALAASIDLTGATNPAIRFYHRTALEPEYDFGYIEISTNGGGSWAQTPLASYTGNRGNWAREQLPLAVYTDEGYGAWFRHGK